MTQNKKSVFGYLVILEKMIYRLLYKTLRLLLKFPFSIFHFLISIYCLLFKPNLLFGQLKSSRIGHFTADIDAALLKLTNDSRYRGQIFLILIPEKLICNDYIIKLIERIEVKDLKIHISKSLLLRRFPSYLKKSKYFSSLLYKTVELADNYGHLLEAPRLFNPLDLELKTVTDWLKSNKDLDSEKHFVFLHNRDSAYLPDLSYHNCRDFSPTVFFPIIDSFKNELNFFRGGKKAIEVIPNNLKNCIDLPNIPHNDIIDILIHERSLFYFGSDSGIGSVSLVFRKPIALINSAPCNYDYMRMSNHMKLGFIPKKMVKRDSREPIGLVEMYENGWINLWKKEEFDEIGIELIDNSPEEALNFFIDSIILFKNNFEKRKSIETPEQEEFWKIVTYYRPDSLGKKLILDNCFINSTFLNKNLYLIS